MPGVWGRFALCHVFRRREFMGRNKELGPLGTPFVRGGDIGEGAIRTDVVDHISPEFEDKVTAKLTQAEDIAFITKGTVGRVGFLRPLQPRVVFAPQVSYWRVTDRQSLNPSFLYYLLRGQEFQANLHAVKTHGSMVADYVSLTDQRNFRLTIPPLEDQAKIAQILGSLDDKIDLNRRMNETLEAMARAIFKSWFVDFDPVRAKMEGRQPVGIDAETAALFPDSFEESDLGEMPIGWEPCRVGDVADVNGWTLGGKDALDHVRYIEISEVMRGEIFSIAEYTRGSEPSRARRRLRHGDTVLSTVRPDRGAYFLCLNPDESLIASTGFAVITPKKVPWSFAFAALAREEILQELGHLADGGAYPAVRPEVIANRDIITPGNPRILEQFHVRCEPLYLRVDASRRESKSLAAIRDALLPKLLSGEIHVKDAENTVEAHL